MNNNNFISTGSSKDNSQTCFSDHL